MANDYFSFRRFTVWQDRCAMKVGTDGTLLGAWARLPRSDGRVLDVGTGTGLIALMMAQRFGQARVKAIDVDAAAVGQARENVSASGFAGRIVVERCAFQECRDEGFDAIVCNPPFFVDALESPDVGRTLARHALSLSFRELMEGARRLLSDGGELSLIVPSESLLAMEREASLAGFMLCRHCAVRTVARKPPRRHLLAYRLQGVGIEEEEQCLDDGGGRRSAWYRSLTDDFYL